MAAVRLPVSEYRRHAQLKSATARAEWIEPDVMPLPV
jgi:hypothetical protein